MVFFSFFLPPYRARGFDLFFAGTRTPTELIFFLLTLIVPLSNVKAPSQIVKVESSQG